MTTSIVNWRSLARTAGYLLVALIVFFLGRALYRSWNQIPFDRITFNYGWLATSFLGLVVSFLCSVQAWRSILRALGSRMGFRDSWFVITGSYAAKYLPGHVWAIGGRMLLARGKGVPEKVSGVAMVLETAALLAGTLIAFGLCLPWMVRDGLPQWIWWLFLPVPPILALMFTPLLGRAVGFAARVAFKREVRVAIGAPGLLAALALFTLSAIIQGAAFFALVRSLYPIAPRLLPDVIGAYTGAWAAGFLSVVTPGGLGVREGALTVMLGTYVTVPVAIIAAAVARLWITVFEVAMAMAGLRMKSSSAPSETIRERS